MELECTGVEGATVAPRKAGVPNGVKEEEEEEVEEAGKSGGGEETTVNGGMVRDEGEPRIKEESCATATTTTHGHEADRLAPTPPGGAEAPGTTLDDRG